MIFSSLSSDHEKAAGEGGVKRDTGQNGTFDFKNKIKYLATSSKSILEGYHKLLQQLEISFGSLRVEAVRTVLVF